MHNKRITTEDRRKAAINAIAAIDNAAEGKGECLSVDLVDRLEHKYRLCETAYYSMLKDWLIFHEKPVTNLKIELRNVRHVLEFAGVLISLEDRYRIFGYQQASNRRGTSVRELLHSFRRNPSSRTRETLEAGFDEFNEAMNLFLKALQTAAE